MTTSLNIQALSHHSFPPGDDKGTSDSPRRKNLAGLSQRFNLYFVAQGDFIHVRENSISTSY
jgi:hypothetical protein